MATPPPTRTARQGFTLIELLVVVAIIGLLISILLPSLSQARKTADDVVCKSILKQFGMAQHMYADSYDGWFIHCCSPDWQKNTTFRNLLSTSDYFETNADGKVSPEGLFCPALPSKYRNPDKDAQISGGWNTFSYRGWGYSLNDGGLNHYGTWWPDRGWAVRRPGVERPSFRVQHVDNNDKNSYYWGVDPRTNWDIFGELTESEGGKWGTVSYRHMGHANLLHFDSHASSYSRDQAIEEVESGEAIDRWYVYGEDG